MRTPLKPAYAASFQDLDLGYHSDIWRNKSVRPSQAFVMPCIGTEAGFTALHNIIDAGRSDSMQVLERLLPAVNDLITNTARAQGIANRLQENVDAITPAARRLMKDKHPDMEQVNVIGNDLGERLELLKAAIAGVHKLQGQQDAAIEFYHASLDLLDEFTVLHKIVAALDTIIKEYGLDYAHNKHAVMKLTVCIKCLDAVWENMRDAYTEMREVEGALQEHKQYVFPFEDLAIGDQE